MDLSRKDLAGLEQYLDHLSADELAEKHAAIGQAFRAIVVLRAVPIPSKIMRGIVTAAGAAMMGAGTFADNIRPAAMARAADLADSPNCAALFRTLAAL